MYYYFYCPNCKKEEVIIYKEIPKESKTNYRIDHYRRTTGYPINYYECPYCNSDNAGAINVKGTILKDEDQKKIYFKHVIKKYQNIGWS